MTYVYSTYSGMFGQKGIVWSVTNGTGSATINSSTGVLTGVSAGTVTVKATYNYTSVTQWRSSCTVYIIPLADGVYFVKNRYMGGYIQLDDDASDDYSASGVIIEQHEFDGEDYQRWELKSLGNGYYHIISVESNRALAVPAGAESSAGVTLIQEVKSSSNYRQQWEFIATTDGAYKIRARSAPSNLVICVNWGVSDGDNIQQDDYVDNNSYLDEWYVQSINVMLPTPLIRQQTSSWCWAACAEMLARTKHPTAANNGNINTIIQEQRDAVYHVFGNNTSTSATYDWTNDPQGLKNKSGIYTDVANAAAYLVGEANGDETFSGYATPYSEAELLHFLLDGHAVARLYGWAKFTWTPPTTTEEITVAIENLDPDLGGHVTVIVGAEWSSADQCYYYTVYDPQQNNPIYCTYDDLLFSVTGSDSEGYHVSFWFPTVVTKTDYSSKTFLENIFGFDYSSQ